MPITKEEQEAQEQAAKDAADAQEKRFAEIANRAAADHAKRTAAKYEKQLEEQKARYEAMLAERADPAKVEPKPEPKGNPAEDLMAVRMKEMEARDAAREKERAKEKAEFEEKKAAALVAEERAATIEALKEIGVSGPPAQAAHLLLRSEGRLGRDDDGKVVFLEPKEGYTDKSPVGEGIKRWADTEAGKAFLPPKGVGGSGNKGGGNARGPKATTRAERVAEARNALVAAFGGSKAE